MGKKKEEPQKTVAIAGCGIGGLTVAQELAERGYKVTIYEASSVIGGKAACERHNDNLLRDHSIKNFSSYYYCMLESMKRIPFDEEDTTPFIDGTGLAPEDSQAQASFANPYPTVPEGDELVPVGAKKDEKKGGKKEDDKKKKSKKNKKTVFDNLKPCPTLDCIFPDGDVFSIDTGLNRSLFAKFREFQRLRQALKDHGLAEDKVNNYVKKHARLLWICDQRKRDELDTVSYEQYLGFDPRKNPETAMLLSLVEVVAAAKVDGSALAAADQALKMFGRVFNPHKLKNTGNLLDGTIENKMLKPWAKYIQSMGGEIYTKKPLRTITVDESSSDKITGFVLEDGTEVKADHYVLALPYSHLKFVINSSKLANRFNQIPEITSERGEKWGHSCHFALSKLPDGAKPTIVTAVLGSPWSVIFYYVTSELWVNEEYPTKEAPVQLWITTSDSETPGLLHKKPYRECTEEEFKEELLFQVKFKEENKALIVDSVVGRGLAWWNKKTETMSPGVMTPKAGMEGQPIYDPFNQGPPIHGERTHAVNEEFDIVCESPLYAREISMPQFTVNTPFSNLFLAGECVKTTQMISTMEKANEGGKRCAHAICTADGKKYPTKKFEYHPLPFRFLRFIDAFFYNMTHPSA